MKTRGQGDVEGPELGGPGNGAGGDGEIAFAAAEAREGLIELGGDSGFGFLGGEFRLGPVRLSLRTEVSWAIEVFAGRRGGCPSLVLHAAFGRYGIRGTTWSKTRNMRRRSRSVRVSSRSWKSWMVLLYGIVTTRLTRLRCTKSGHGSAAML